MLTRSEQASSESKNKHTTRAAIIKLGRRVWREAVVVVVVAVSLLLGLYISPSLSLKSRVHFVNGDYQSGST
ncbi:hypothetical protein CMV_008366 [Castanea mollissima]|uniref:Uncharacterized protein n=1 Tax=Castanea mollissima TaxID=60419 RepID=A0A8J4RCB4_9ROSI|nr:hypothetical protein CMV_008366 [Castanea mollissima]